MPIDGCVFHVDHPVANGERIRFTWEAWGKRAFTAAELQPAVDDLQATRLRRFTSNFLRFNVTPGDIDWFDDFGSVSNNAAAAARVARAGKARGILFDVEPYNAPVFDYSRQKLAASKSWEDYAAQARLRGREVMQAFEREDPDITVFLTFGYSIAWAQMENGRRPLARCQYGLLPAFLDGLVDAATGKARLVDGCELAYGYKETRRFRQEYETMRTTLLPIVAEPDKYHAAVSLGFGLWMDYDSHKHPWNLTNLVLNFYSPDQFAASLREALAVSDEYVWVYTEVPRWWTEAGPPTNLPTAYIEAVRGARGMAK